MLEEVQKGQFSWGAGFLAPAAGNSRSRPPPSGKGKQEAGAGRGGKGTGDSTAGSERGGNRRMLKRAPSQGFMEGGQALQLGALTPLPLELGARDASS